MQEKPSMLLPALYGGIIMAVISAVPGLNLVNCFCCAGVLFGGFMAVFFYKKELMPDMPPMTSSDGVQLGALAGVFGGIIGSLLSVVIMQLAGNVGGEMMLSFMEGFRDTMPPEAWDNMEESIREGHVSPLQMIFGVIINVIFGLLGGLIGYSVFKPKQQIMNIQPPSPPTGV
jgi:hypothetical protein